MEDRLWKGYERKSRNRHSSAPGRGTQPNKMLSC